MLYNNCTGIYKFGNNTYPGRIRGRSNLGHIFRGKKVRPMGRGIRYIHAFVRASEWAGNARARWSLARRTTLDRAATGIGDRLFNFKCRKSVGLGS
jgi:hypothetical protein